MRVVEWDLTGILSRNRAFGIATLYRLHCRGGAVRVPGMARLFCWTSTGLLSSGYWWLFVRAQVRKIVKLIINLQEIPSSRILRSIQLLPLEE
jgi:hypothetical protein